MTRGQGRPAPGTEPVKGTTGTLYVVATPLGNLEDLSPRALRVLGEAPVIACEDSRTAGMLLHHLGVSREGRRLVPYHDANEGRQVAGLMRLLAEGTDVALISEAGTPLISDPGYRLVAAARAAGIPVRPVPGPCAAIAALSVSGLPTDRFCFLGFLPAKPGRRRAAIAGLSADQGTCICHVPARSVARALEDFREFHPDWTLVIAREMTKMFEEFLAGTAADLLERWNASRARGEVTLLAAPPLPRRPAGA